MSKINGFGDMTSQRYVLNVPNKLQAIRAFSVVPTYTYEISGAEFDNAIGKIIEHQLLLIL